MRKKILLSTIVVFALLLLCCTISKAANVYEAESYTLNIPDSYTLKEYSGIIQLTKNSSNLIEITPINYSENDVIIDEKFLQTQRESLEQTYLDMGYEFAEISTSKIEKNGCQGTKTVFNLSINNVSIYMAAYYFVSDNYLHTIAVGSTTAGFIETAEKEVVNTFKVKDTVLSSRGIPFTDIPTNAWYYNAVKFNYANNMIKGLNDYTYGPSANLTRGMLVTILWRMEGNPKATSNQFTDVTSSQYYYNAVNWAASKKIISGYGDGKFGPNDNITREQLAVILRNYAQFKKKSVSARTDLTKYTDNTRISSYAKDAVSWAVANKIISGKANGTQVDPQGKATRAEVAAMLYNYCMNIK